MFRILRTKWNRSLVIVATIIYVGHIRVINAMTTPSDGMLNACFKTTGDQTLVYPAGKHQEAKRIIPSSPAQRTLIGGQVSSLTGGVTLSETDLIVPGLGMQYCFTRDYIAPRDVSVEEADLVKGDLGYGWESGNSIKLLAEDSANPPGTIIVRFNAGFQQAFTRMPGELLQYKTNACGSCTFDKIVQQNIDGKKYWVLFTSAGMRFSFHPLDASHLSGCLHSVQDAFGNSLTYYYNDEHGRPTSVVDSYDNTVQFTYYNTSDCRNGLLHAVQWIVGDTIRQSVYYAYDEEANLARVTTDGGTGPNQRRTWMYIYGKNANDLDISHQLLYVVAPEQYLQMQRIKTEGINYTLEGLSVENPTSGDIAYDPDIADIEGKSWEDYAFRRYTYGNSGADNGRIIGMIADCGESLAISYDNNPTDNQELPEDLKNANRTAMVTTVTHADGFVVKQAVSHQGQLRCEIRSDGTFTEITRWDYDEQGRIIAVTHPGGRRYLYIYQTIYDPSTNQLGGKSTERPSYEVIEYIKKSDPPADETFSGVMDNHLSKELERRVKVHYTYGVPGFPRLPSTKVVYRDGTSENMTRGVEGIDTFTTNYIYNYDGTLHYEVHPMVRDGRLPGSQYPKNYRLGTEYTYSAMFPGLLEYEKRFICDSFTSEDTPAFTKKIEYSRNKYIYYSSGSAKGLLLRKIIDEGQGMLNLTTEYQYDEWRHLSTVSVDPDNVDYPYDDWRRPFKGDYESLDITTNYLHDHSGNLIKSISPGGYNTIYSYDKSGNLWGIVRRIFDGHFLQLAKTEYDYDLYGRIINSRSSSSIENYSESWFTYDNRGRVENHIAPSSADGQKHGRKYKYDQWGNLVSTAVGGVWGGEADGSWLADRDPDIISHAIYVPNHFADGLVNITTDGYGDNIARRTYDSQGRLETIRYQKQDANYGYRSGCPRTTLLVEYSYDNRDQVTRVVNRTADNRELNEIVFVYDSMGRVTQRKIGDGKGHYLTYSYDYDQLGRLWRVTDPSGSKTTTAYDAADRVIRHTDGCGNITATAYDAAGRVIQVINKERKPDIDKYLSYADNQYIWYVTAYEYDKEGRVTKIIEQGEDVNYDSVGEGKNGIKDRSEDYLITTFRYTHNTYKTSVVITDPCGHHQRFTYDGLGRRILNQQGGSGETGSENEAYLSEIAYEYDNADQLTAIICGGGDGIVDTESDNQTTFFTYNEHGQLETTRYPDNGTVTKTWYPHNDVLKTVTDQNGVEINYEYQAILVRADLDYIFHNQVREFVSNRNEPAGDRQTITTRDGLGRIVAVETNATPWGSQTSKIANSYTYWGAIWKQTQQLDYESELWTVEYEYDEYGRMTKIYWPYLDKADGYIEFADHDGLNRPTTLMNHMGDTSSTIAKYKFIGHQLVEKEYPLQNPLISVKQVFWSPSECNYDRYGRTSRSHIFRESNGGQPVDIVDLRYQFDDADNPTWRYDVLQNSGKTCWSQKYEYDTLNRLSRVEQGTLEGCWPISHDLALMNKSIWVWNGQIDMMYCMLDGAGNWCEFYNDGNLDHRRHNSANEIDMRIDGNLILSYQYDENGNLVDDDSNFTYVYDYRNRLVEVRRFEDDHLVAKYFYDGLDHRIRKIVYDPYSERGTSENPIRRESTDTYYLYNAWGHIIETRNENNAHQLRKRFIRGCRPGGELVCMYHDRNADKSFDDTADMFYYLHDCHNNVVALVDAKGDIKERAWYKPYGCSTCRDIWDGDETVGSHYSNPYLFGEYELDEETLLLHKDGRYFSTTLGRYMTRTSIGCQDNHVNLYSFSPFSAAKEHLHGNVTQAARIRCMRVDSGAPSKQEVVGEQGQ